MKSKKKFSQFFKIWLEERKTYVFLPLRQSNIITITMNKRRHVVFITSMSSSKELN